MARPGLLQQLLKPFMRRRTKRRSGGDGEDDEQDHLFSFSSSQDQQTQAQAQAQQKQEGKQQKQGSSVMLGAVAVLYVAVDYLRVTAPGLHSGLQPLLWAVLAVVAASRAPFYPHWSHEIRAAPAFLASLAFMLLAFCIEAIAVQFVTSVLGLSWHQ